MVNPLRRFLDTVKHSPVEGALLIVLSIGVSFVAFPNTQQADAQIDDGSERRETELMIAAMQNATLDTGHLPQAGLRGPYYVKTVVATAYNSVPEQTDDTPFITASGTTVRHGVVAANFLPIGTRITIPEYYGDQTFIVEDRMHERYSDRVDIWMAEVSEAKQFGKRQVIIHVYP